jgi:hypothetical protein
VPISGPTFISWAKEPPAHGGDPSGPQNGDPSSTVLPQWSPESGNRLHGSLKVKTQGFKSFEWATNTSFENQAGNKWVYRKTGVSIRPAGPLSADNRHIEDYRSKALRSMLFAKLGVSSRLWESTTAWFAARACSKVMPFFFRKAKNSSVAAACT